MSDQNGENDGDHPNHYHSIWEHMSDQNGDNDGDHPNHYHSDREHMMIKLINHHGFFRGSLF
jgi:hypothetical protein